MKKYINKRYLLFVTVFVLFVSGIQAQSTLNLRINELLSVSVNNIFESDFSVSTWFETINASFGRLLDGEKEWRGLTQTTPSSMNVITESETANNQLLEQDPVGIIMAATAMSVVFLALAVLYLLFKQIGKLAIMMSRKRARKAAEKQEKYNKPSITASGQESGEICAAIAFALNDYLKDEHDIENTILTINKVARTYSPWNSKIYSLRHIPDRK